MDVGYVMHYNYENVNAVKSQMFEVPPHIFKLLYFKVVNCNCALSMDNVNTLQALHTLLLCLV